MADEWRETLAEAVELFGHRNWIVIADAAYPLMSAEGLSTLPCGASQVEVLGAVWQALADTPHVRPIAYVDAELAHVREEWAPGIGDWRGEVERVCGELTRLPHAELIERLDRACATFQALVLKTDSVLPYSSVFFELDCEYWDAEREAALRAAM